MSLEDLVGGRALAWVGGVAVLVGIALLLAVAASSGRLDATARTALAACGSVGLVVAGIRLHARRTDAALAAVAAGIAGAFATIAVAAQQYEVVPAVPALLAAAATAATATAVAVRWSAPGIGALGLGGALLAPVLAGAGPHGGGLPFLLVAATATVAVLVWRRWIWLGLLGFALATPQWLIWAAGDAPAVAELAVVAAFGVLNAVAAVGHDVRSRAGGLRVGSQLLLGLSGLVTAAGGAVLSGIGEPEAWLAAVAVAHVAAAGAAMRSRRCSDELARTSAALAVVLADVTFALVADGLPLVLGWAATGAAFAALLRHGAGPRRRDALLVELGLGGHVVLALATAVAERGPAASGSPALLAAAAGCFVSARLAQDGHVRWRALLDTVGLATTALVLADMLDGAALTAALAAEAVAVARIAALWARRDAGRPVAADDAAVAPVAANRPGRDAGPAITAEGRLEGDPGRHVPVPQPDPVAAAGALALLIAAGTHAVATLAPPDALVEGLGSPLAAVAALAAAAAAALWCARTLGPAAFAVFGARPGSVRTALEVAAAVVALHLLSVAVVTVTPPDAAQLALSGLWAATGVGILVAGLRLDQRTLRHAALSLLGLAAGKVFVYDLGALESVYRAASFVALGLLLLGGAHAWQRLRPQALR